MTQLITQDAAPVAWDLELRGAAYLMRSGLCPAGVKSPEAALFIILAGRDLGLSPVAALRNIHVIQGKVEVSADLHLALFAKSGGTLAWVALSDTEAAIRLTAPWLTAPHVSRWTMEDARRAGLGGDNWKKYPRAMLRSRAITSGLKDIGFDATAGVYAPGEISETEVEVSEAEEVQSTTTVAETAGEGPTAAQVALFEKMLRSHVFNDDRETWAAKAAGLTTREMGDLLDMVIETGRQRKATERAEAIAAAEAAS